MKPFAFLSDFDGTLSQRDFYHLMIDRFFPEWGHQFYQDWKKTTKINVEFLNHIFGKLNLTEEQLLDEIRKIPLTPGAIDFVHEVQARGGDFYIVSAGTSWYIERLMQALEIPNVTVISMPAVHENGALRIVPDTANPFFSEIFGLDKRKVLEDIRGRYRTVLFAGDSEPDLEAAKAADIAFARGELRDLLTRDGISHVPVDDYHAISGYLKEKGWPQ
ncbi:MtnX-like HAD-IB family phosphatase [Paenibacillus sp. URB8-2]|uniref:MtnX-like HAD-IB family phosphatase n=1 Tax=Paenibacillus sp. URB8-2 TaxID=2741301 RepID=UPI0015B8DA67|nr:MtnX-like HAD-IB family phosphatase [Paenibacillus sp. URB8-2]BCG57331.1 phosphoserine phosphatase [Paenibacillus sp. URB8-2]